MRRILRLTRVILRVAAVTVTLIWPCSYLSGFQVYHSAWYRLSATTTRENANWLWSNYGSAGVGWRSQQVSTPMHPLPKAERHWEEFAASPSALSHIHPEGPGAWHWFDHLSLPTSRPGSTITYGHLFVPYWFLLALLLAADRLLRHRQRARTDPAEDTPPPFESPSPDGENTAGSREA